MSDPRLHPMPKAALESISMSISAVPTHAHRTPQVKVSMLVPKRASCFRAAPQNSASPAGSAIAVGVLLHRCSMQCQSARIAPPLVDLRVCNRVAWSVSACTLTRCRGRVLLGGSQTCLCALALACDLSPPSLASALQCMSFGAAMSIRSVSTAYSMSW